MSPLQKALQNPYFNDLVSEIKEDGSKLAEAEKKIAEPDQGQN